MAEPSSSTSPETIISTPVAEEPSSFQPEPGNPNKLDTTQPTEPQPSSTPLPNPNHGTPPPTSLIPPPSIQPYAAGVPPSFRPAMPPLPQFSPLPPNPNLPQPPSYQTPGGVPPPGVSAMPPPPLSGAGQIPVSSSVPPAIPPPYAAPGQPLRPPYVQMPNGYLAIPQPAPQGTIPPVY